MTKEDFYKLAIICGINRGLGENCENQPEKEMSEAMADCIAFDILDLARKELCHLDFEDFYTFKEEFYRLSNLHCE